MKTQKHPYFAHHRVVTIDGVMYDLGQSWRYMQYLNEFIRVHVKHELEPYELLNPQRAYDRTQLPIVKQINR